VNSELMERNGGIILYAGGDHDDAQLSQSPGYRSLLLHSSKRSSAKTYKRTGGGTTNKMGAGEEIGNWRNWASREKKQESAIEWGRLIGRGTVV